MIRIVFAVGFVFFSCAAISQVVQSAAKLDRRYQNGEAVSYRMRAINEGHLRTVRYEANAAGIVKQDPKGGYFEEFAWADLRVDGEPVTLSESSRQFKEDLSMAPEFQLAVPDLSKVQPILIGPITDLLAFYADVQLSMRQDRLTRAGDHVLVKHGIPNSWADGTYVLVGQDAVDFDITLQSIDQAAQIATLVVRHVPPAQSRIKLPAEWMLAPVGHSANNWVEVEKGSGGKILAEVGMETFEDEIKIALPTGRIVSAAMENPVSVLERDCDDATLTACGPSFQYGIKRRISLEAVKP